MKQVRKSIAAFSMLELIAATAMLSTVMGAVVVIVRTSYTAWEAHEQDIERTENVYATLRHIVRQIRQADAVSAITASSEIAGSLSVLASDGSTLVWERDGTDTVRFGVGSATDLLASYMTELSFTGYEADGVTQTLVLDDIQLIECRAKTVLQHGAGEDRVVTCRAWLRTW